LIVAEQRHHQCLVGHLARIDADGVAVRRRHPGK